MYFLLADAINTTITVVSTLQSEVQAFDGLILAYLFLVAVATQAIGVYVYWLVQRRYNICTKTMLNAVCVSIVLLTTYGLVGIWTKVIGFHNRWEFWIFQAYLGFFVSPWYNYSQTMVRPLFPIIF